MPADMKRMIASTFAEMTKTRQIDKITVKDLVERCGISRQTFYYHFQDILDVMEWCIRQMVQGALQESLQAETPQESIRKFVHVAVEHGELLLKLSTSQRHAQVERIWVDAMRSSIRQMLRIKKPELTVDYQDLEVALSFFAYGIAGVLFEKSREGQINEDLLSRQLYHLLSGDMIELRT